MTAPTLRRLKVYDLPLRFLHACLGLCILGLAFTGFAAEWVEDNRSASEALATAHLTLGRALAVTLVLRFVWGFVGPASARWKDQWHPAAWREALHLRWPTRARFGHDPLASAAYLALYAVAVGMVFTGFAMEGAKDGTGPLMFLTGKRDFGESLEGPHAVGAWLALAFTAAHLLALAYHTLHDHRPMVQAMVTGNQYQPRAAPPISKPAVLLLCVAGLSGVAVPALCADPASLLEGYASLAREEEPSFAGFSVERGRAFYEAEHTNASGTVNSCVTCHLKDPRYEGRSRAGRVLAPLSPLTHPQRFTHAPTVEKWFARNCRDVLERPCTAQEKGDLITYLQAAP